MRRLRILAATPYYPPEGGGLERYAHEVLRRLAEAGNDVRVMALTRGPSRVHDVEGVAVRRANANVVLSNTPLRGRFPLEASAEIRRARPDVVVAHTPVPFAAEAAALAARRAKVPYVVTYHAGALEGRGLLGLAATFHRSTFEAAFLRNAAKLVAVSDYVRDGPLAAHRDRTVVIPPGVDARRFRPVPAFRDPALVLFVGPISRAYEWKGFRVLFDAFAQVAPRVPRARLRVVGAGDLVASYQREAARLGLEGRVRFAGRLDDSGLARAYRHASVLVLPSTRPAESFGLVLAEANASGAAVVASRVGGIPCFVRDGENGLLVPPGDVDALAQALERVLSEPKLAEALGARGRDIVLRDHDWGKIAERTEAVLAEVASAAR